MKGDELVEQLMREHRLARVLGAEALAVVATQGAVAQPSATGKDQLEARLRQRRPRNVGIRQLDVFGTTARERGKKRRGGGLQTQ